MSGKKQSHSCLNNKTKGKVLIMDSKDIKKLKDLLYNENNTNLSKEVINMENPLSLHVLAANYNWDNGFEIPNLIINNKNCDLGTALLMFYNADGFRFLESGDTDYPKSLSKWKDFMTNLFHRIKNNDFKSQSISYTPQISKVQMFKLKKINPNIPNIFFERSPGIEVDIPVL